MTKIKTLEGLVADAVRKLRKLEDENKKLSSEAEELRERVELLQVKAREFDAIDARRKRAKSRVERILDMIEEMERGPKEAAPGGVSGASPRTQSRGAGPQGRPAEPAEADAAPAAAPRPKPKGEPVAAGDELPFSN